MSKKLGILIIVFFLFFLFVSLGFYIKVLVENDNLIKLNQSLTQQLATLENKIVEVENQQQGKIMSEKNWECKWNCSNYLIQKDYQQKTVFNNRCHEDCRRELDRIVLKLRADASLDLEREYEINYYLDYIEDDKPVTYKLINQDLGNLIGDKLYKTIFAWHVYEAANVGFRVVPFPYREENSQIVEVAALDDLFFNKNGERINCTTEVLNQELCQVLQKYESNDRADGMLLDCASKQCNFLKAVRTNNSKRCSYINQFTVHATDDEWIELCEEMTSEK